MSAAFTELAESIANEPGLIWKLWTENREAGIAGGIYLLKDNASAEAYLHMHTKRLGNFGVREATCKLFEINKALSVLNRALL